jgi:hypothetical protein
MTEQLYGTETQKDELPDLGRAVPLPVIHWLARIKGRLPPSTPDWQADLRSPARRGRRRGRRRSVRRPVPIDPDRAGHVDEHERQRGALRPSGGAAHPNDHVNMGQSSNDVPVRCTCRPRRGHGRCWLRTEYTRPRPAAARRRETGRTHYGRRPRTRPEFSSTPPRSDWARGSDPERSARSRGGTVGNGLNTPGSS